MVALLWDASTWELWHYAAWVVAVQCGMEVLTPLISMALEGRTPLIEIRGKHLDKLEPVDVACIMFNKGLTNMFVYHTIRLCYYCDTIELSLDKLSVSNTIVAFVSFYVVYDFFYTLFHGALHHRSVYALVHKHHHRQKAPSRGNLDAINVHPFEFLVGEYLHLLTVYLVPCHAVTVAVFVIIGGIFASLNHTRFDVSIPGLYTVKNHDVHHVLFNYNYGQYIMLWDHIFGSFKAYDEDKTANSQSKAALGKAQ